MNSIISLIYGFYQNIGVPAVLLPLFPFMMIIIILYLFMFLITKILMLKKLINLKTASFYLFISPWVIGFILFTFGPIIYSLYISMTDWQVVSKPVWIGLQNYKSMLSDGLFYQSLKVTFYYTLVAVPLQVICGYSIALLMNLKLKGIYAFRTIFYIPTLVQGVAQMVLFIWIFDPNVGLINAILKNIGITGPGWFGDPNWSMPAVIIMSLWTVGGTMIIYLAGFQDIPQSLYEQAEIDGANAYHRMVNVTLPQMSPIIFFTMVTSMIGAFQTFTQGFMISGGPKNSLLFYAYYLYENAFMWFKMGYGSALAWVMFIIIVIFTLIVFKSSSLWVYYETEMSGGGKVNEKKKKIRNN